MKKYVQNNPEMYSIGAGALDPVTGLRTRPGQLPPTHGGGGAEGQPVLGQVVAPVPSEVDDSPATSKAAGQHGDDKGEHQHKRIRARPQRRARTSRRRRERLQLQMKALQQQRILQSPLAQTRKTRERMTMRRPLLRLMALMLPLEQQRTNMRPTRSP